MPKQKTTARPPALPAKTGEEALQEAILHRLGVENVPTHRPAWLPLASLVVPDEEHVRVPGWLVRSIQVFGIMQAPSVVRAPSSSEDDPLYEVVAGRRRTLAARKLGFSGLTVEVYTGATPELSAMLALTENAQRARAWRAELQALRLLISQGVGLSERDLLACGFARQGLTERLKMARLPADLLDQIMAGQVPQTLVRSLVALTPDQLARVSEAARFQPLTRDLVKQALRGQIIPSLSPLPTPAWEALSPPPSRPAGAAHERPGSLQDLLAALHAFRQGPEYHRLEEAHLLVQALMQHVEVAIRETALPASAS